MQPLAASPGPINDGPLLIFDANGDGHDDVLQTRGGAALPVAGRRHDRFSVPGEPPGCQRHRHGACTAPAAARFPVHDPGNAGLASAAVSGAAGDGRAPPDRHRHRRSGA